MPVMPWRVRPAEQIHHRNEITQACPTEARQTADRRRRRLRRRGATNCRPTARDVPHCWRSTCSQHAILMLFNGGGNPPKLSLTMGGSGPHLIHGYLGPPHPTCLTHLHRNCRLLRAHAPLSLYFTMGQPLPHPKIASYHGWIRTPI